MVEIFIFQTFCFCFRLWYKNYENKRKLREPKQQVRQRPPQLPQQQQQLPLLRQPPLQQLKNQLQQQNRWDWIGH